MLDDLNMSHEEKRWYFCFMFHTCFKQSNMLFKNVFTVNIIYVQKLDQPWRIF